MTSKLIQYNQNETIRIVELTRIRRDVGFEIDEWNKRYDYPHPVFSTKIED